jgi:ASPIC and UnbV
MSNSEPSAIVLHGIACIRRIIHKVRFEWRKRFAHRASSFPAGWLAAALIGIGAKVRVRTNAGTRMFATVKTGSSYLSQSELPLTFGLGKPQDGKTVSIEIVWPSGQ